MRSLIEMQLAFSADHPRESEWPARHVPLNGIAADPRFNVYRNSVHSTLCDALAVIYPVVAKLVDVRFFRQTARQYLRAYPASAADLRGFGLQFAEFLGGLRALRTLPCVADVARLEWALYDVQHAPEDPHYLDLTRLQSLAARDLPRMRFRLHRATALVASRFPVHRIWEAHQEGAGQRRDINLDAGGVRLLVARTSEHDVGVRELSVGEYTLLSALRDEHALEDADALAELAEPQFDLARTLARFVALGVVAGIRPDIPPER